MSESVDFKIGASWTEIDNYSPLAFKTIEEATSCPNPQAFFSSAYRRGYTDGKFHLLKKDEKFPTGLLFDVIAALEEAGVDWNIVSSHPDVSKKTPRLEVPESISLRDYQEEAAEEACSAGRGILSVPVNGGKSYIAAAIVQSFDWPAVVLVARAEGLKQMYTLFVDCFGEDSVATDVDQGCPVVVMTYATATKRDLSDFKLLVADEVHRVAADTFFKASMSCSSAYNRFGLSGTPMGREDGKDIYFIGATGDIIYTIDQQFLVDRGYSAKAEIAMIETMGVSANSSRDWHKIEDHGIVNWDDRNRKIVEVALAALREDKQVLVMVKRINHGETLKQFFMEEGLDVPFTNGKISQQKRLKYYDNFKSKDCMCLIASGIYDDSVDVPDIEVLINAAGGKSAIATKQKLGRGLRNPGGKQLLMVDFWDRHHNILFKHSKKRKKNYESEGFKVFKVKSPSELFDL